MLHVGLIINFFSLLGAFFALWKGDTAARWVALVVIGNLLIGQFAQLFTPAGNELIRLVNDGLTALLILGVTVRYAALWMGGVMLFFAAQFSLHSYYLVMERATDRLYAQINNIDFLGVIWCLIFGTAVAWRRRVRTAPNPS